mmetsp:Transcript_2796/g.6777  ORF Transcript_2796/g.6777 Transcript_2796/m.6777 type:complete len:174 (+) Transcript_2796:360-881(+)
MAAVSAHEQAIEQAIEQARRVAAAVLAACPVCAVVMLQFEVQNHCMAAHQEIFEDSPTELPALLESAPGIAMAMPSLLALPPPPPSSLPERAQLASLAELGPRVPYAALLLATRNFDAGFTIRRGSSCGVYGAELELGGRVHAVAIKRVEDGGQLRGSKLREAFLSKLRVLTC